MLTKREKQFFFWPLLISFKLKTIFCISFVIFIACKYVITDRSVVRERGCGGVGVSSRQSFCKNIYKDVVECYCTTDFCNGIDASNTALSTAEEHFRRLAAVEEQGKTTTVVAAANTTVSIFWLTFVAVLSLIWG